MNNREIAGVKVFVSGETYDEYKGTLQEQIDILQSKIDKAIEYIEKDTRWFDSKYASVYSELCDCKGYNANRLEVMVNPSNLLKILNDEVEIPDNEDEEKKIPEKLEYYDDSIAWVIDDVGQLSDVDKVIIDKLNDVIDYLKSKEE